MKKKLPVRWDDKAQESLDGICDFIAEDSVSAARHVKKILVRLAGSWATYLKNTPKKNTWPMNRRTIGQYPSGVTRSFMK